MMTPHSRRKMLHEMGLAPAFPTVAVQRAWALIDDRVPPDGEADGEFTTFTTWVNKASSWIGWTGSKCFDAKDRPCRIGADFMRARDEGAFPVRWYEPHRFAAPKKTLGPAQLYSLQQLAKAPGRTLARDQIKSSLSNGPASPATLNSLVGLGFVVEQDNGLHLTDHGATEFSYEQDRLRRASYVRRA